MEITGQQTRMPRSRAIRTISVGRGYCAIVAFLTIVSLSAVGDGQSGTAQRIEIPASPAGFNPERAQDTTFTFHELSATFRSASSPMQVTLDRAGVRKSVTLPPEFVQVSSARLFSSNRLVVVGQVNGDVSQALIIDSDKGEVIDKFFCYSPSISPDGRYVAFVKFYPAHGVDNVEDRYSLYDAKLPPDRNRPSEYPRHPGVVGKIVYPVGLSNRPGDNVDLSESKTHRMTSDEFFWNGKSDIYVFADQLGDNISAVIVDISGDAIKVSSTPIQSQWICPDVIPCFEHLARVSFSTASAPTIELEFRGVNGTPAKRSRVAITELGSGHVVARPGY